jgi:PAS domain S-box-containing protein
MGGLLVIFSSENFANKIVPIFENNFPHLKLSFSLFNGESNKYISFKESSKLNFDFVINISSNSKDKLPTFFGFPPVLSWSDANIESKIVSLKESGTAPLLIEEKHNREMILESLDEAVIAHDLNRQIFYFSRKAEEITGFTQSEVIGKDCHEVFTLPICGDNCQFCDEGECSDIQPDRYLSVVYDNNSQRRDVLASITPLTHSNGKAFGSAIILKNLTHEKELERQLDVEQQFHRLRGNDSAMRALYEMIRNIGVYDFPVLIQGESGTGKELVADAIHKESRRTGLFVPVNCGAIPEGTLESELFGHVKGSFTGAIRNKKGRFELAENGTIFLDEVGELPLSMQVKLLRVIQEGVVDPVGSESSKKINVRIMSATNKNLLEMVEAGTFREDLYYRLAVVPVDIPPLRDRNSDTILLAQSFLAEIGEKFNRNNLKLSKDTESLFLTYSWPGNVRQLINVVQYAMIKCKDNIVEPRHLPPELLRSIGREVPIEPVFNPAPVIQSINEDDIRVGRRPVLTRDSITEALVKAGGNKAKAARVLGVGRATLYNYIKKYPEIIEGYETI